MAVNKYSMPQADNIGNGFIDSGPYSAEEAGHFYENGIGGRQSVRTPATGLSVMDGVIPLLYNDLEPSLAGLVATIESGGAYVAGRTYSYDTALSFTIPVPSVSTRNDRICLILNNTASPITQDTAGHTFVFPSVLTIYNGLSSIPAYTARLVLVLGTEGAGAPALEVDRTGIFMLPLVELEITTGGVINYFNDDRRLVNSPLADRLLIEEVVISVAANQWDFTSIPQCFNRLRLECFLVTPASATMNPLLTFNNDLAPGNANYYGHMQWHGYTSIPSPPEVQGLVGPGTAGLDAFMLSMATTVGATYHNDEVFYINVEIFNYNKDNNNNKFVRYFGVGPYLPRAASGINVNVPVEFTGGGYYQAGNNVKITTINLRPEAGGASNWQVGSTLRLIGIK